MDDLVRFLTACLDEDELIARDCSGAPWEIEIPPMVHVSVKARRDNKWKWGRLGYVASVERDEDRAHIVAHDPARVLREIDAKRRLVRELFAYEAKIDGEWGCCHNAEEIEAGECEWIQPEGITGLRLLASVYADRPSYREEWRP